MTLEQFAQVLIPALVGAASTGVPLWIQLRKNGIELRKQTVELELFRKKTEKELNKDDRINTEAEWRRVIDEKKEEITRLRAKDDEQETKINDLLNRHIECAKNEARQEERAKHLEKRTEEQSREIKALTNKVLQLEKLLRENFHAAHQQSGVGAFQAATSVEGYPQEEARGGPVQGS